MGSERLPRRMLTAWVPAARPSGGQLMTYGRSVYKALDNFGIPRTTWHTLAADRVAWREAIHGRLAAQDGTADARCGRYHKPAHPRASLADARATSSMDIDASIMHSFARANISSRAALADVTNTPCTHTAATGSKNDSSLWLLACPIYKPGL